MCVHVYLGACIIFAQKAKGKILVLEHFGRTSDAKRNSFSKLSLNIFGVSGKVETPSPMTKFCGLQLINWVFVGLYSAGQWCNTFRILMVTPGM